ncbi:hypothetical protein C8Q72DRAFT_879613 [Fomitopsis betulina]|nr:hypothetical protein C8Q72DRAFT_879613 [Fomitopsis betulina]
MQSATHSHAAHSGPGYYSLGGHPPSSLGFNNDISFNPSLDGLYTQLSSHVWPDGSPVGGSEYAALEALANSRMVLQAGSYAHLNYEVGDPIHASAFNQVMCPTAQLPGAFYLPSLGGGPLWGYSPGSSMSPDAGTIVNIDSRGYLAGTPPSYTMAGSRIIDPGTESHPWLALGNYTRALSPCDTYGGCSSPGSYSLSAASHASIPWATIFSPAASLSPSETTHPTPAAAFPCPELFVVTDPPRGSKTQRARKVTPRVGRARSSASKSAKPIPSSSIWVSKRVRATPPRNKRVPKNEIKEPLRRGDTWFCSNCSYQTRSKGIMSRHMNTHSADAEWVCCGVPVEDVFGYTGEIHIFEGKAMAGGCLTPFNRKDSFLRHLRLRKGQCITPAYLASS